MRQEDLVATPRSVHFDFGRRAIPFHEREAAIGLALDPADARGLASPEVPNTYHAFIVFCDWVARGDGAGSRAGRRLHPLPVPEPGDRCGIADADANSVAETESNANLDGEALSTPVRQATGNRGPGTAARNFDTRRVNATGNGNLESGAQSHSGSAAGHDARSGADGSARFYADGSDHHAQSSGNAFAIAAHLPAGAADRQFDAAPATGNFGSESDSGKAFPDAETYPKSEADSDPEADSNAVPDTQSQANANTHSVADPKP